MLLIGGNLGMGSPWVETAVKSKDKRAIQELAARQVEAGAEMFGIDLGPKSPVAEGVAECHSLYNKMD